MCATYVVLLIAVSIVSICIWSFLKLLLEGLIEEVIKKQTVSLVRRLEYLEEHYLLKKKGRGK